MRLAGNRSERCSQTTSSSSRTTSILLVRVLAWIALMACHHACYYYNSEYPNGASRSGVPVTDAFLFPTIIDTFHTRQRTFGSALFLPSHHPISSATRGSTSTRRRCWNPYNLPHPPVFTSIRAQPEAHEDDEWHPHDPAWTTPQLLQGLWSQIAQGKDMVKGEAYTVMYPQMEEQLNTPRFLNLLFAHLDSCKDVCDHFGITTTLVPYKQAKAGTNKIVGFTVKSFRNPEKINKEFDFEYDPYFDDGTDFEALYQGIDEEQDGPQRDPYPPIENRIPSDDDEIIATTKRWVSAVMSDMGICPFTQGAERAGLPMGDVFYCVDRSTGFEDAYARYWHEVSRLEQNTEKEIATILLILPEFCIDQLELFESFTTTLTQPLAALGIEDLLQLVFFHPQWSFRDGGARASATGQAANYARRSPWPMINLLRTSQVRTAQKGIPTGLVYKQNEKTLSQVGVDQLEIMLRKRDWSASADYKVNRRELDALKIAQDFQATGVVDAKDTSLHYDATPAANRVDRRQVEEGNLVNVLMQALEKRLGKAAENTVIARLSGPETSATAMAGDVLLGQLDAIIAAAAGATATAAATAAGASATPHVAKSPTTNRDNEDDNEDSYTVPDEVARARQERMEEARRALFEDLRSNEESSNRPGRSSFGDPMTDVLFGRGGISFKGKSEDDDDDEMFPEGMDPKSFY